jgi:hypothetical protein
MSYLTALLACVSTWYAPACRSGGVDLKELASESNKTWLSLERSFTEWSEREADEIELETDVVASERRLSEYETTLAKWDSIRSRVVALLGAIEAGNEIDDGELRTAIDRAATLIGALKQ